jgi:hypothetical protein
LLVLIVSLLDLCTLFIAVLLGFPFAFNTVRRSSSAKLDSLFLVFDLLLESPPVCEEAKASLRVQREGIC